MNIDSNLHDRLQRLLKLPYEKQLDLPKEDSRVLYFFHYLWREYADDAIRSVCMNRLGFFPEEPVFSNPPIKPYRDPERELLRQYSLAICGYDSRRVFPAATETRKASLDTLLRKYGIDVVALVESGELLLRVQKLNKLRREKPCGGG